MKPTYEQLEQQVLEQAVLLANAESKCRELAGVAAENAALKKAADFATAPDMWIEQADGMLDYRYCEWYVDVLKAAMETPATDAFLAEVRAQGVEMFAMCIAHRVNYSEVDKSIELDALSFAEGLRNPAPELSPEELTELAAQLRKGAAL